MGLFGSKISRKKRSSSEIDLETQLQEEKQDMIQGIEDLPKTSVKEVMVPRIDVDFLSVNIDSDELYQKISESGHSRFPVYRDSIDNVVGVLYVKDIIKVIAKNEKLNLEKIIRKPFFVPESKRIDSLLREFKRRHVHIAMAIDEYGGISGIVSMEDIIEEIVGDIQDEFDNEHEDIISLTDKMWLVDGRINLSDLNEQIGSEFPVDDFDTLGGFVFDLFGKIPVKFEKVSWNNFDFIVQDMEGHRINLVKIIDNENSERE
ncbi:MAG: hemolysin family protein [Treponemataceae bacterium]|nr:hemolysin family protein [Spirochaetales bacterium]MDY6030390.1 hemolysin family protein [Treponemataceae bacterium]